MTRSVLAICVCFLSAAAAEQGYYGPPPCRSDERPFQGIGMGGDACAAKCTTVSDCPKSMKFENATAQPDCESGYCVLICGEGIGQCAQNPVRGDCHLIGPIGVCLYNIST
jgi:hypothetical protein